LRHPPWPTFVVAVVVKEGIDKTCAVPHSETRRQRSPPTVSTMRLPRCCSLSMLALVLLDHASAGLVSRADKPHKEPDPDCTVTNPATNEFYDLRPLIRHEADKCVHLRSKT